MSPDDARHGTTRGHAAGCREQCCREARNADERRRRKRRQVLGIERRIPSLGTQRRIRALFALGWTSAHIARECGWTTPQAVTVILEDRRWVFAGTAERVAVAYERLSATPGPSATNRRRAAAKGWLPPLAWDDIDDPDAEPYAAPERPSRPGHPETATATLEDFDWLTKAGESPEQAAARLGVTLATIERYRLRVAARGLEVAS